MIDGKVGAMVGAVDETLGLGRELRVGVWTVARALDWGWGWDRV